MMSIVIAFQIKNKKLDSIHCRTDYTGTLGPLLKSRGHLIHKRTYAHKKGKMVTVPEAYTGLGQMGHLSDGVLNSLTPNVQKIPFYGGLSQLV